MNKAKKNLKTSRRRIKVRIKRLTNKEVRQLLKDIDQNFSTGNLISKKDVFEIVMLDDSLIYMINSIPSFFIRDDKIIPTLKLLDRVDNGQKSILKTVIVDKGAIKFIVNGADVMMAGIVSFDDDIKKSDIVQIIEETYKKRLAIGISLFSSEEINKITTGKVIRNIHRISDEIYNLQK